MRASLWFWVASVGGIGCFRPAPGTWGSLVGLALAVSVGEQGLVIWLLLGLGLGGLGWYACHRCLLRSDQHRADPPEIVIDEVAGQWLALTAVPHQPFELVLAFGLFRLFDILKPGPVGWADRRLHGGSGIMLDDLIAGLLACLATHAVMPYRPW